MTDKNNISPRGNSFLLGQETAEEMFLRAWRNRMMHHAFILHGLQGVGKATLAFRIARFLLSGDMSQQENNRGLAIAENSAVFQQVAAGSYPDLLVVERDYIETDRKKIISALRKGNTLSDDELSSMRKSAVIRVDDIRKVNDFLAKTSFNDGWRVVIIDSADDMNKNAANALLKILEEPPAKTLLLLISHNLGQLLPTIRSRCAKLPCRKLTQTEVSSLLRRYRPQLSEAAIAKLAEMSDGSIGKAILYADMDAADVYETLCGLLYAKNKMNLETLLDFCGEMAANTEKFSLLQELILRFLKENMPAVADKEGLYGCWQETRQMFFDCVNVNMDKRQMLINLLSKIGKVL